MLFKERNFNYPEKDENADVTKRKKNILKRILSQPALQRILLASLLAIYAPSDVNKTITSESSDSEKTEILKDKVQDSLTISDSSSVLSSATLNESLSEEEYKINTKDSYPWIQEAPVKKRVTK
ncbi:MAG: hypothetical protein NTY12_04140 [Candidatus Falkowbacteria bacterium]|nr:hypothetical protein [Candidatus Falkowbacteria bacterium]